MFNQTQQVYTALEFLVLRISFAAFRKWQALPMIAIQAPSALSTGDDSSRLLGRGIRLDILDRRVFSNHHRRILVEQDVLLRCAVEDLQSCEEANLISKSTSRKGQITVLINGTSECFGL